MMPELADAAAPFLLPQHEAMLRASAISDEVLRARGYRSIVNRKHLQAHGFSEAQSRLVPCLYIPVWNVHGEIGTHQIRPDTPRTFADGSQPKYEMGKGERLCLDVNPLIRPQLADPSIPLWVSEGCKKTDAAISAGLCCIGLLGVFGFRGKNKQGGLTALGDWEMIALRDRQVFLGFDSDVTCKPTVQIALRRLYRFLQSRGASVNVIYLPEGENGAKTGLDDYLHGHSVEELLSLAEPELRHLRDGKTIETRNRQLRDIAEEAYNALLDANEPPELFVRGGSLVRIHLDENQEASIQRLAPAALRGHLARCGVDWVSTVEGKGERNELPPKPVVEDLLTWKEYHDLPPLQAIVNAPVFALDGTLTTEPGYHPSSLTYYHAPKPLALPDTTPTPQRVKAALALLCDDLLGDFPFVDQASRAHALCYLLQPFVRPLIPGPTPIYLFDAPKAGTGKGLLMECCTAVSTGRVSLSTAPKSEEEWGKFLVSAFLTGRSHLLLDNVRSLNSEKLFAAITADYYEDRLLGGNETISLPVRVTWAATCNNIQATDELTRRGLWTRMDSGVENPDERQGFRHPDLLGWVQEKRAELIGAVLIIVRYWLQAGRPDYSGKNPPLGKFEAWTRILGGILETVGVGGFLDNRKDWKQHADSDSQHWRDFVTAWWEQFEEKAVPSADLFPLAQTWLGDKLGDGTDRSQRIKLGKLLTVSVDRIYVGKKILCDGKVTSGENKGAALYRLEPITQPGKVGNMGNDFSLPHTENQADTAEKEETQNKEEGKNIPYIPHFPLTLALTPSQQQLAHVIAQKRTKGHDHCRKASESHGSEETNRLKDYFGVSAEVGLTDALERHGIQPEGYHYLTDRPPSEPDFTLHGKTFDIKATPPEQCYICINAKKHDTPQTRPDFYAVCLFDTPDSFRVALVLAAAVDTWEKAQGHSAYYRLRRECIEPILSLDEFLRVTEPVREERERGKI